MAQLKCKECGNIYTAFTEFGLWPICPECKRSKENLIEQKKQTAINEEILKNEREKAARQLRLEEERIQIEKEKAKKTIEIALQKEKERKSSEAKKRINEISEKILTENKGMLFAGFSFHNIEKFEKNILIKQKDSNGFYLDVKEIADSEILLDKIDLVGYKKVSDKWQNYEKYDNGKFLYYLSSNSNEVEKILFLEKNEIEDFEKILTEVDDEIIRREKERKKTEQLAKEKQERENEINNITNIAISLNNQLAFTTNQKLLLLFKFAQQINKSLKNNFQFFIEILSNQKKKILILKYLNQTQDILVILSELDGKFEDLTKDLLLFENTLIGKKNKFQKILNKHEISNEQLSLYLSKFSHFKRFIPKTKKFIYSNIINEAQSEQNNLQNIKNTSLKKENLTDTTESREIKKENIVTKQPKTKEFLTGVEYVDTILNSNKFIISTFTISIISSVCFIAGIVSFNFVALALFGHMIALPLLIYIRFKHKIKILPIIIIFIASFIFALVFAESGDSEITAKTNIQLEKK